MKKKYIYIYIYIYIYAINSANWKQLTGTTIKLVHVIFADSNQNLNQQGSNINSCIMNE